MTWHPWLPYSNYFITVSQNSMFLGGETGEITEPLRFTWCSHLPITLLKEQQQSSSGFVWKNTQYPKKYIREEPFLPTAKTRRQKMWMLQSWKRLCRGCSLSLQDTGTEITEYTEYLLFFFFLEDICSKTTNLIQINADLHSTLGLPVRTQN